MEDEVVDEGPFCICRGPDDGTPMVACDECDEWYHLSCIGIDYDDASSSENYFCRGCRLKRGDTLSSDSEDEESSLEQSDVDDAGKDDAEDASYSDRASSTSSSAAASRKRPSARPRGSGGNKKKRAASTAELAADGEPAKKRQRKDPIEGKMRQYVRKSLRSVFESSGERDAAGAAALAEEVELALHDLYREEEQGQRNYATKFRSLFFNLKDANNYEHLLRRVLSSELKAAQLVAMSTQDLANPQLAHEREAATREQLARVLKTGEEEETDAPGRVGVFGSAGVGDESQVPAATEAEDERTEADVSGDPEAGGDDADSPESAMKANTIGAIAIPSFSDFAEPEEDGGAGDGAETMDGTDGYNPSLIAPPATPDAEDLGDRPDPSDFVAAAGYPRPVWSGTVKSAAAGKIQAHLLHLGGPPIEELAGQPNSAGEDTLSQVGRMPLEKLNKYLSDISATSTSRQVSVALMIPHMNDSPAQSSSDDFPRSFMLGASRADVGLYARFFASLQSAQRAAVLKCEKGSAISEAFVVPIPKASGAKRPPIPAWASSAMDPTFICVTPEPSIGDETDDADPTKAFLRDDCLVFVFLSARNKEDKRAVMKLMSREREDQEAGRPVSLGSRRRLRVLGVLQSAKASADAARAAQKARAAPAVKPVVAASNPVIGSPAPAASNSAASQLFAKLSGTAAAASTAPKPPATTVSAADAKNLLSQLKSLSQAGFRPAGSTAPSARQAGLPAGGGGWPSTAHGSAPGQYQQQQAQSQQQQHNPAPSGYNMDYQQQQGFGGAGRDQWSANRGSRGGSRGGGWSGGNNFQQRGSGGNNFQQHDNSFGGRGGPDSGGGGGGGRGGGSRGGRGRGNDRSSARGLASQLDTRPGVQSYGAGGGRGGGGKPRGLASDLDTRPGVQSFRK